MSKRFLGSGIILNANGKLYTVVTNAHVLGVDNPPYQIQTSDGLTYKVNAVKAQFGKNDLALLEFNSDTVYPVATVTNSSTLKIGDKVYVGGFIANNEKPVFTIGQVAIILDKPLERGYQIGYTNYIRKGMSGAALFNNQGKVVGINGIHQEPLWDALEVYQDGSIPCQPLQNLITRYSFAIPIETLIRLAPKFKSKKNYLSSLTSNKNQNYNFINSKILESQAELAKQCREK